LGNATISDTGRNGRIHGPFRLSIAPLLACCALMLSVGAQVAAAQGTTDAKPQPPPTKPTAGNALICIYRLTRIVGSATHDSLFVNGVFLATLHSGEYACTEVAPGTVVVSGTPKMYYGPSVIMSSAAALTDATKKENERIRIEVEAGKTYYLKWTSGVFATGVKVTPVDEATGAKEMSKLHPSKAPEVKSEKKEGR
jgi:hypothetical protein